MKELKDNKEETVYIPDEFFIDFTLSKEERDKIWEEHCRSSEEAWAQLEQNASRGRGVN